MMLRKSEINYMMKNIDAVDNKTTVELSQSSMMGRLRRRQIFQRIWIFSLTTSGMITIFLLLGVFTVMIIYGWPFLTDLREFWKILSTNNWYPADEFGEGSYGALAMIYGTFFVGIPALVFATIFGTTIAIFLSEYTPKRIARMVQPVIEYIAAIPSVIFGLIAFVYLSQIVKNLFHQNSGRGPLTASITLAIMATPIIVSISFDALQSTPIEQRNAAKAFGATRFEVFRTVTLPHAKMSISASILLAFSRVLGETMVVLMVLGNSPVIKWNFFSSAYTLTSAIANEIGDASFASAEFSVLFVLALILLVISFMVIFLSNLITTQNPTFFKILDYLFYPFKLIGKYIANIKQGFNTNIELTPNFLKKRIHYRIRMDFIYQIVLGFVLVFIIGLVFTLLYKVLADGFAVLSLRFLLSWPTYSSLKAGEYGIYSAIIGSVGLVLISSLIAFPIATATGIYLQEFALDNKFTRFIRMAIVNISSIPSVVVGLFVYGLFSIYIGWKAGLLPGGIALGVMMIPIISTNTIEALRNVPSHHKNSALVVGATNWEAVSKHKLPYALPSIITGYVLAIARVIGETAPLLFIVAGFSFATSPYPSKLIQEEVRVLPYEIFYNLLYSHWDGAVSWAIATAIVLLAIVAILNAIAYLLRIVIRRKYEYNGNI